MAIEHDEDPARGAIKRFGDYTPTDLRRMDDAFGARLRRALDDGRERHSSLCSEVGLAAQPADRGTAAAA